MSEKQNRGGRREGSGRKRIWASVKEGARMRMRKMRAKRLAVAAVEAAKEKEEKIQQQQQEILTKEKEQNQTTLLLKTLKKRVMQLETENMQLKMQRFQQSNEEEFDDATNNEQSSMITQEERDREQLTEGEYLRKYPRRRVNPARVKTIIPCYK